MASYKGRPLLRRQLDALADWLAKDYWTVEQAACLLVGVLPDEDRQKWLPAGEVRRGYGACLPGRKAWPDPNAWHWHILSEIEEMQSRLVPMARLGKVETTAVLRGILEAGDLPLWWHVANDDPVCAAWMTAEMVSAKQQGGIGLAAAQEKIPEWLYEARSKGGRVAAEVNYPGRQEQMTFVLEKIRERYTNKRILDLLAAEFSDAYLSAAEEKWIPDMRKQTGIRRGSTSG